MINDHHNKKRIKIFEKTVLFPLDRFKINWEAIILILASTPCFPENSDKRGLNI